MSSNFPNGFAGGVTIRGVPLTVAHPGEVFWVNNSAALAKGGVGGSDGNDGSYRKPLSTIDAAINKCKAGRGDIIMVMPGHVEVLTNSTGIVPDVDGVAIVGLGSGNDRATIQFNHANATITVTGANVAFYNMLFLTTITAVTVGMFCGASTSIINCEFNWELTGDDFVTMVNCDTMDGVQFLNNRFIAEDTAGCNEGIRLDTATDTVIKGNYFYGDFTDACIVSEGALSTNLLIESNFLYNSDTTAGFGIDLNVADTGVISNNRLHTLFASAPETTFDPGSCLCNQNYCVNAIDERGTEVPPTQST